MLLHRGVTVPSVFGTLDATVGVVGPDVDGCFRQFGERLIRSPFFIERLLEQVGCVVMSEQSCVRAYASVPTIKSSRPSRLTSRAPTRTPPERADRKPGLKQRKKQQPALGRPLLHDSRCKPWCYRCVRVGRSA